MTLAVAKPVQSYAGWTPNRCPRRWRAIAKKLAWGVVPGKRNDIYGANGVLNDPTNESLGAVTPWGYGYQLTGTRSGDESASWDCQAAYGRLDAIHRHYAVVIATAGSTVVNWESWFSLDREFGGDSATGIFLQRQAGTDVLNFYGGYDGAATLAGFSSAAGYLLSDGAWHVYAIVRHDQTCYFLRDGALHSTDSTIATDGSTYTAQALNAVVLGNYRVTNDTGTLYKIGPALLFDGFLSLKDAHDLCHDPTGPLRQERGVVARAPVGGAFSLVCDTGSFTLSGQAALGKIATPAAAGSFALAGQSSQAGIALASDAGAFTLSGQASLAGVSHPMSAGAFAVTGQTILGRITTPAAAGVYTLTGIAADLGSIAGETLVCAVGLFTLTGFDVILRDSIVVLPPTRSARGAYPDRVDEPPAVP